MTKSKKQSSPNEQYSNKNGPEKPLGNNHKPQCAFDELLKIDVLKPNPKNPHQHSDEQVTLLAKIIDYQGWRSPIVISKRSGYIVAGHARLKAAQKLGLKTVPVDLQDFKSEADELAHLLADNRIAELADPDTEGIKGIISEFGAEFDLDLTGFDEEGLNLLLNQITGANDPDAEWEGMPDFEANDETSKHTVHVHFSSDENLADFAKIIGQTVNSGARIWHPSSDRVIMNLKAVECADES